MELMIVIVILGVLSTVGIGAFISSQLKGKDTRRKSDLTNIAKALEAYYNDKSTYPTADASGNMRGCYPDDATVCVWGAIFKDKNNTVYMPILPKDPTSAQNYYYNGGSGYFQIYALLENNQDVDLNHDGAGLVQYYDNTNCGSGKHCNWGVASTNYSLTTGHALTTTP